MLTLDISATGLFREGMGKGGGEGGVLKRRSDLRQNVSNMYCQIVSQNKKSFMSI